MDQWTSD